MAAAARRSVVGIRRCECGEVGREEMGTETTERKGAGGLKKRP
jgi:hypothetical protein